LSLDKKNGIKRINLRDSEIKPCSRALERPLSVSSAVRLNQPPEIDGANGGDAQDLAHLINKQIVKNSQLARMMQMNFIQKVNEDFKRRSRKD
jgi:hypothetical protein